LILLVRAPGTFGESGRVKRQNFYLSATNIFWRFASVQTHIHESGG
jgi:hypothetical protein